MIVLYVVLSAVLGLLVGLSTLVFIPLLSPTVAMGRRYAWLAMACVGRGVFLLQEDGELNFKRLKYDAIGEEKVKIGGEIVTLSDPARSLSSLAGKTFALGDELHGVLFRVTDAAVGQRKRGLDANGALEVAATPKERNNYEVTAWVRKWLTVPTGTSIDLRDVRQLATGQERGVDAEYAREWYKFSRIREGIGLSVWKHLVPPAAFIVTLIAIWQIGIRMGGGGSGSGAAGGNGTTLSILAALAVPAALRDRAQWLAAGLVVCSIPIVGYLLLGALAVWLVVAFVVGFAVGAGIAFGSVILLALIGAGGPFATPLLDLALYCFDEPAIVETAEGYELRDGYGGGATHKLGKHRIGFRATDGAVTARDDYAGSASSIDRSAIDDVPDDVDDQTVAKSATGRIANVGWLVPPVDRGVLVDTAGAFGALASGFIGNATDKRIQEAKKEYGGGDLGASDTTLMWGTLAAIVIACVIGGFLFV